MVIFKLDRIVALPDDLDRVHQIVETTIDKIYPLYYPDDVVQFFLDHHSPDRIFSDIVSGFVFLFNDGSETVGTGTIHQNEIARVFVLPEYQGKGFGSAIMDQRENVIFQNYPEARLDSSLPAFGLYLKRGYIPCQWHTLTTPRGQVLCYYAMEKEYIVSD
jgi:GNAT superfamily N-acetyltransferase